MRTPMNPLHSCVMQAIYRLLVSNTCSDGIAVAFLQLHLGLDFQRHRVEPVELVARTFHNFQHTIGEKHFINTN